uniref:Uncharacterized protein n=1 Tax=Megaviridae environmental sample TaxID=1737588 RepID=A0A5J6VMH7_9VIRU|nr:MAG: hypothetical protein [Megaviridae environmental sample]
MSRHFFVNPSYFFKELEKESTKQKTKILYLAVNQYNNTQFNDLRINFLNKSIENLDEINIDDYKQKIENLWDNKDSKSRYEYSLYLNMLLNNLHKFN